MIDKDQIEVSQKRNEKISQLYSNLDAEGETLLKFHKLKEQKVSEALKTNLNSMFFKQEYPDRNIEGSIAQAKQKRSHPNIDWHSSSFDVELYNRYMLEDDIVDPKDP